MDSMTFCASCSPCTDHFVKNKNASPQFKEAANATIENNYMDDYVASFNNAIRVTKEIL